MLAKRLEDAPKLAMMKLPYSMEKIAELAGNIPPLYLTKPGPAGWGVAASRKLLPFVPVTIYGGEGVAQDEMEKSGPEGEYRLDSVEAHRFRNLGAMINEAFPNCIIDAIHHPSGISYPAIVPIRTIEADEELFIDYLPTHDIKLMKRCELNPDAAKDFLKPKGLLAICRDNLIPLCEQTQKERGNADPKQVEEMIVLMTRVQYLIGTPSLLIQLILENTITPLEIRTLSTEERFLLLFNRDAKKQKGFGAFVEMFEILEKFKWETQRDVFKEIQELLMKLSKSYNTQTCGAAFQYITMQLKLGLDHQLPTPEDNIAFLFKQFEPYIPVFETMRTILHQQRDATDQELSELRKISKALPVIEGIYLSPLFRHSHS